MIPLDAVSLTSAIFYSCPKLEIENVMILASGSIPNCYRATDSQPGFSWIPMDSHALSGYANPKPLRSLMHAGSRSRLSVQIKFKKQPTVSKLKMSSNPTDLFSFSGVLDKSDEEPRHLTTPGYLYIACFNDLTLRLLCGVASSFLPVIHPGIERPVREFTQKKSTIYLIAHRSIPVSIRRLVHILTQHISSIFDSEVQTPILFVASQYCRGHIED